MKTPLNDWVDAGKIFPHHSKNISSVPEKGGNGRTLSQQNTSQQGAPFVGGENLPVHRYDTRSRTQLGKTQTNHYLEASPLPGDRPFNGGNSPIGLTLGSPCSRCANPQGRSPRNTGKARTQSAKVNNGIYDSCQ